MILSGKRIAELLNRQIFIDPFNPARLNPNSYNLSLNPKLLTYQTPTLDMKAKPTVNELIIPEEGLVLEPGKLYLGQTNEFTRTEGLVPMLEGRSSIGRLGLMVHVTAGFGDVGFAGYWTLELFCVQPIRIYPNVEICQIYYHMIDGEYESYSSSKYQGNMGVQPSMLYKELTNNNG